MRTRRFEKELGIFEYIQVFALHEFRGNKHERQCVKRLREYFYVDRHCPGDGADWDDVG
jgi:hypothetical protein